MKESVIVSFSRQEDRESGWSERDLPVRVQTSVSSVFPAVYPRRRSPSCLSPAHVRREDGATNGRTDERTCLSPSWLTRRGGFVGAVDGRREAREPGVRVYSWGAEETRTLACAEESDERAIGGWTTGGRG